MTNKKENIPVGMKKQKICHDDSCPPFSNFCTYCSGSRNCYSEDFRIVPETDQLDEIHIATIKERKEKDDLYNIAIDQAIEVVKSEYQTVKAIGEGEKYYEIFNNIAMKIRNLLKTNQ